MHLLQPSCRIQHLLLAPLQSRGFGSCRKGCGQHQRRSHESSREPSSSSFEFWYPSPLSDDLTTQDIKVHVSTVSDIEGWIDLDACGLQRRRPRGTSKRCAVKKYHQCCRKEHGNLCHHHSGECHPGGCSHQATDTHRLAHAFERHDGGSIDRYSRAEKKVTGEAGDMTRSLRENLSIGVDSYGRPALVRAALWRRPDLVRELLHEGADPTESTSGVGDTAIRIAVEGNNEEVLNEIVQHVGPSGKDIAYNTIDRKREALKNLLSVRDKTGRKVSEYPGALAIQIAISRAYEYLLNICKFVVDDAPRPDLMRPEDNRAIPVHVDSVDWSGETALFSAVRGGHLYKAEFLLDNGAAVDKEVWGRTALHEAVRVGAVDLMRLLLKHGANPNLIAKDSGLSCLHTAIVCGGDLEVIRSLLDNGADPAIKSLSICRLSCHGKGCEISSGSTAMHFAMQLKRRDIAAQILDSIGPLPSDVDAAIRDEKSRRCEHLMHIRNDAGLLAASTA